MDDLMNGGKEVPAEDDVEDAEKLSLKEIFARLDAAGAADFVLERDQRPCVERDWESWGAEEEQ